MTAMIRVNHFNPMFVLATVFAAPAAQATTPAIPGPASVLSVGTGLILVIGAILVTGWLYSRTQKLRGGPNDLIRVVASQPLGTRERVVLLQVADQQLLVGMTSTHVQTLHVFDEPVASPPEFSGGFGERLRAAIKGQAK